MKITRFVLATLTFSGAPMLAAPAAPPATPPLAPVAVSPLDARAIALFDQSVKAYAALPQLSQEFSVVNSVDSQPVAESSGSGSLMFQRPDSARVEATIGEEKLVFVTDGATFSYQVAPNSYQQQTIKRNSIQSVISSMPSAADTPLSLLVSGRNPINDASAPRWQSAQLNVKDGLTGVVLLGPKTGARQPATFGFYLDPKTHLLARVEVSAQRPDETGQSEITLSEVTNFIPNPQNLTPANFRYVPGPGVERFYSYDKNLTVGARPFALTGNALNGQTIDLDRYKGRVVLLDFWATWCGPCRAELPNVIANYKNYHPWGFDIVAVSLDEAESEGDLRQFIAANKMAWPQLFDGKGWESPNVQTYGVKGIPFTLLLGKDGKIAAINPRGEDLEPEIRAALMK